LQVIATQSSEEAAADSAGTAISAGACTSTELASLCAPDQRSVMRPISHCLFNDDAWLGGQATVQSQLEESGIYLLHPVIAASTAKMLHVSALSSVVHERLDATIKAPAGEEAAALTEERATHMREQFHRTISSPIFVQSVCKLLMSHQQRKQHGATMDNAVADGSPSSAVQPNSSLGNVNPRIPSTVADAMNALELRFVNGLYTKLLLGLGRPDSTIDVANSSAESKERLSFLHKTHAGPCELYVNVRKAVAPLTVQVAVATGLCQRLNVDHSLSYAIAALMDTKDNNDTLMVLESLHVHADQSDIGGDRYVAWGIYYTLLPFYCGIRLCFLLL
jgi:hypothetical protein